MKQAQKTTNSGEEVEGSSHVFEHFKNTIALHLTSLLEHQDKIAVGKQKEKQMEKGNY